MTKIIQYVLKQIKKIENINFIKNSSTMTKHQIKLRKPHSTPNHSVSYYNSLKKIKLNFTHCKLTLLINQRENKFHVSKLDIYNETYLKYMYLSKINSILFLLNIIDGKFTYYLFGSEITLFTVNYEILTFCNFKNKYYFTNQYCSFTILL